MTTSTYTLDEVNRESFVPESSTAIQPSDFPTNWGPRKLLGGIESAEGSDLADTVREPSDRDIPIYAFCWAGQESNTLPITFSLKPSLFLGFNPTNFGIASRGTSNYSRLSLLECDPSIGIYDDVRPGIGWSDSTIKNTYVESDELQSYLTTDRSDRAQTPNWFPVAKVVIGDLGDSIELGGSGGLPLITHYGRGQYIRDAGQRTDISGHVLNRKDIRMSLERVLRDGFLEVFEYGMESDFSRGLEYLIRRHSNDAVAELDRLLEQGQGDQEVREEALLQLGSIEHKPTHHSRLSLLIKYLGSDLVSVRDSAALGIAAIDDPVAIGSLHYAVQVEKSERLRRDLQLVLDQLAATLGCRTS